MKLIMPKRALRLIGLVVGVSVIFILYHALTVTDEDGLIKIVQYEYGRGDIYYMYKAQGNSYIDHLPKGVTTDRYNFTINNIQHCSWTSHTKSRLNIGIVILSKSSNFKSRNVIRETWANCSNCGANVGIVFLLGQSKTKTEQTLIDKESRIFKDIVQVNLVENYDLLTYKSMAMLEWFYRYCSGADVYIKADDDVYMNINNIAEAVSKYNVNHYFSSQVMYRSPPERDPSEKTFVSRKQYAGKFYPTYCSGPTYLFSATLLEGLYKASFVTSFFSMEDVYITGILSKKLSVDHAYIHSSKFEHQWNHAIDCKLKHSYTVHHAEIQDILNLHIFLQNCV